MPTFSQSLEKSLHQALTFANERHQEFATLEHLLLALLDDKDAANVMKGCSVDLDVLRASLLEYIDTELANLVTGHDEDSKPTAGFHRVIQRAVIHVHRDLYGIFMYPIQLNRIERILQSRCLRQSECLRQPFILLGKSQHTG